MLVDGQIGDDADACGVSACGHEQRADQGRRQATLTDRDFGADTFLRQRLAGLQAHLHGEIKRLAEHGAGARGRKAGSRGVKRHRCGNACDD